MRLLPLGKDAHVKLYDSPADRKHASAHMPENKRNSKLYFVTSESGV